MTEPRESANFPDDSEIKDLILRLIQTPPRVQLLDPVDGALVYEQRYDGPPLASGDSVTFEIPISITTE